MIIEYIVNRRKINIIESNKYENLYRQLMRAYAGVQNKSAVLFNSIQKQNLVNCTEHEIVIINQLLADIVQIGLQISE